MIVATDQGIVHVLAPLTPAATSCAEVRTVTSRPVAANHAIARCR
jgi:hypothetical protein